MFTVDELKKEFGVFEDQELAEKFNRTASAVSLWRKNGVPAAIERKAIELLGLGDVTENLDDVSKVMARRFLLSVRERPDEVRWQILAKAIKLLEEF